MGIPAICTGTSTCEVGTPARLTVSTPFLTQVHSIVASQGIVPPRPGCRQLPTGTSFHSSHKPSITSAICTGTSTCEVGTPARLTVSTPYLTQVHSIVASPGIAPPRPGCRQVPTGTSFHFSQKPSISSAICTGTSTCEVGIPARLTVSTPFLTQVHSIVASPGIAPPRPGCRQVSTGTSFHSSHKPSITSAICTGTSTCEVDTPARLTVSTPFLTQVHSIVASPGIAPPRPGCRQVPTGTSFHSSYKRSITSAICTGTSTCEVGTPARLTVSTPFLTQVHSIVASTGIVPPRPGCRHIPTGTSFHSSHKPSITSAICTGNSTCEVGTPARLTVSTPFLTQVHSIVACPSIAPPRPGCWQLPTGTSFHSSHKPSISSAICTGTSTCEVGTPARLTVSTPFLTQVHSIVASPGIAPPRPRCRQVPTGTSFHSSHKPSITSGICTGTSTCASGHPCPSDRFHSISDTSPLHSGQSGNCPA